MGNGGFPRSKVAEIFGDYSSGKSTLAAMACAKAQAQGLYPVYVDVERGLDRKFAENIGFDVGAALAGRKGLYTTPETFEDMLIIVEKMVTDGAADLVIVDSVPALVPKQFMEAESIADAQQLGLQAKLFAASLPKLTKIIDRPGHKTSLVFVNQIRANIQTGWMPPGAASAMAKTKTAGGYALGFYSSLRVELKQIKKIAKFLERPSPTDATKMEKIPVASLHSAMTFKNKVAPPYRSIEFYIRYDYENNVFGIDNLQTILDIGVAKGQIEAKGGGNFLYNGVEQMSVRGEAQLYDWFLTHEAARTELRQRLGV